MFDHSGHTGVMCRELSNEGGIQRGTWRGWKKGEREETNNGKERKRMTTKGVKRCEQLSLIGFHYFLKFEALSQL